MVRVIKLGIKRPATHGLLPDPEPRKVSYTLISVDDHLMEPPHTFEGRLPRRLQDQAPRVVETEEGHQVWQFDGQPYFQVGFMCVAGPASGRITGSSRPATTRCDRAAGASKIASRTWTSAASTPR